jgi:hypothetical protein
MHWIDPIQLPLIKGIVERFIVNGQGESDGLVLDTGDGAIKLVHFPSHMSDDIAAVVKPGDPVGVRGLKPRDAEIIAAVPSNAPTEQRSRIRALQSTQAFEASSPSRCRCPLL